MFPLLPYAGNKYPLTDRIIRQIVPSEYQTYIEPFGGIGSLLFSIPPKGTEVYNEVNPHIHNLMTVVKEKPEELLRVLNKSIKNPARDIPKNYHQAVAGLFEPRLSLVEKAASLFIVKCFLPPGPDTIERYANSFPSKIRDFDSQIGNIFKISRRLGKVELFNENPFQFLHRYNDENTFVFLDPPYESTNFELDFAFDDRAAEALSIWAKQSECKIVVAGLEGGNNNVFYSDWPAHKLLPNKVCWRNCNMQMLF